MKKSLNKKLNVVFLGGVHVLPSDPSYHKAEELAKQLALQGYIIISGGSSGIMEASNKGAFLVSQNQSKAFICSEDYSSKRVNNYVLKKHIKNFKNYQNRTLALFKEASVLVFFPGGLGSFNELSELLLLTQIKSISSKTTILFNENFWTPLISWMHNHIISQKLAKESDISFLQISNSVKKTLSIIENSSHKTNSIHL